MFYAKTCNGYLVQPLHLRQTSKNAYRKRTRRDLDSIGGFKVERRKVPNSGRRRDVDRVPRAEVGDRRTDLRPALRPATLLHRIVADCPPEKDAILDLAGRYGLMTASIALRPEPGKPVPLSALSPEPVDIWCREIHELRAVGDLWDRIAAGDRRGEESLERKLAAGSPAGRFI